MAVRKTTTHGAPAAPSAKAGELRRQPLPQRNKHRDSGKQKPRKKKGRKSAAEARELISRRRRWLGLLGALPALARQPPRSACTRTGKGTHCKSTHTQGKAQQITETRARLAPPRSADCRCEEPARRQPVKRAERQRPAKKRTTKYPKENGSKRDTRASFLSRKLQWARKPDKYRETREQKRTRDTRLSRCNPTSQRQQATSDSKRHQRYTEPHSNAHTNARANTRITNASPS